MEVKKSKGADLESKRWGFMALGGVIAGALVLMAFSYQSIVVKPIAKIFEKEESKKEEIPLDMFQNEPPPPPPPPQAPPPQITELKEVEDDKEIPPPPVIDEDLRDFTLEDEGPKEVEKTVILDFAEVNPEFPGGEAEMAVFIRENFEYPEIAREMGEQGTVYVEFVVNKDGSIVDARVVKPVSPSIDKEALRVVKKMPKWKPGEQAGKPVTVRYTIPIKARLG
ncbi:MAG: energy transducer TonB [Putridiphycobacter sp.]|jgi:protein TonB|nr:energy transducer TonB [Putridiphycobacter sp.]